MIEKRIRGGIATILCDRYVKPWNRYTQPEHYEIIKLCTLLHSITFNQLAKEIEAQKTIYYIMILTHYIHHVW